MNRSFATLASLLLVVSAAADDGVTVNGTGRVMSPPDRLHMAVSITGSAEMAGDAVTKYRGQRERFLEAIRTLGVEDLKALSRKTQVTQASSGGGNRQVNVNGVLQQQAGSSSFTVQETIILDMPAGETSLETASRLYDLGRDLGVKFVPPSGASLVEPQFTKAEEARERATADAIAKATAEATQIATLAGRSLGRVEAVEVLEATSHESMPSPSMPYMAMPGVVVNANALVISPDGSNADPQGGSSLTQQATTVRLVVRFAFED